MSEDQKPTLHMVSSKPSEAEIAADLRKRVDAAMEPVLAIMDEALGHGMQVQWDGLGPAGFPLKIRINNLRIIKCY